MKVLSKQRNSKMCAICGLDNKFGVRAHFYNMEDNSVMTPFMFREEHQSYPGRVHGGLIAAMLDELGLRACWANGNEDVWGVTLSMEVKYRKPVPYNKKIFGRGKVESETSKFLKINTEILDEYGNVLSNAQVKYIKLNVDKITDDTDIHEEMPYLIEDNIKEINFKAL
jgi:uncharacterized protein (TIGR00369 family)